MKNYTLLALVLLLVGVVLGLGFQSVAGGPESVGGPISTDETKYPDGTATTSVIYLTAGGASSDVVVNTSGWESFSVDTQLNASSTATVPALAFQVSQDGIDWFDLPNVSAASLISNTVGSTTAPYTWSPQTAGITRSSIKLTSDHKYWKIKRSLTGANGSIWQQVTPTIGF